jgi:hypothetical protein
MISPGRAVLVPSVTGAILATMPSSSRALCAPVFAGPLPIHDEEELELPPLDGLADEEERDVARPLEEPDIAEEASPGEDDGTGIDLDPAAELDVLDDAPGEGSEAARDAVDIGSLADAIALMDERPHAPDGQGLAHDEEEASLFDGQGSEDAGIGTGEDPAGFVDEDALPPLGVDDDEDGGARAAPQRPAQRASPWDRGRYHVATRLGAEVPCGLLAVSAAYVVAAGPAVLVVGHGARMARGSGPDIDAVAVAATEDTIFAASRRGVLFASTDGGDTWTAIGTLSPAAPPIELAATPGRLWICQRGALWSLRWSVSGRAEPLVLVRKEGVRAMASVGTALLLLAERSGDVALERLRGDDEASEAEALPEAVRAAAAEGAPLLAAAAGGRAIALGVGRAVHVSRDGGRTFQRCDTGPARAVTFAGTEEGAHAMVLVPGERRADGVAHLVEVDPDGACTRVAEIAGAGLGLAALAWDPAREVLWIACGAGLLAFERSARH